MYCYSLFFVSFYTILGVAAAAPFFVVVVRKLYCHSHVLSNKYLFIAVPIFHRSWIRTAAHSI